MAPSWEKLAVNLPSARDTANPGGSASMEPELEQEGQGLAVGTSEGQCLGSGKMLQGQSQRCAEVRERPMLLLIS